MSSLPREVSDDASLQPAPRLLLSQAPQSLLSRAQEALQRTHLEMFASSNLVILAVMEAICMQNIAGVVVTKVENCSGGTDIDNRIEGLDTRSHYLDISHF